MSTCHLVSSQVSSAESHSSIQRFSCPLPRKLSSHRLWRLPVLCSPLAAYTTTWAPTVSSDLEGHFLEGQSLYWLSKLPALGHGASFRMKQTLPHSYLACWEHGCSSSQQQQEPLYWLEKGVTVSSFMDWVRCVTGRKPSFITHINTHIQL